LVSLQDKISDPLADDIEYGSQQFSSSDNPTTGEDSVIRDEESRRRKTARLSHSLTDNLGICFLSCFTLRLPITIGDILSFTKTEGLVYYRAIDILPADMKRELSPAYRRALDPSDILHARQLHKVVYKLVTNFQQQHLELKPLNLPPLLYRFIKHLSIPLEVYPVVKRIAELINFSFKLSASTRQRYHDFCIPEIQLLCCLIVAIKILAPFDGNPRYPYMVSEPAVGVVDWVTWVQHYNDYRKATAENDQATLFDMLQTQESDVFVMDDEQIDKYLHWYYNTWAQEAVRGGDKNATFREAMFEKFPIDVASHSNRQSTPTSRAGAKVLIKQAQNARYKGVHSDLIFREAYDEREALQFEDELPRPGSDYEIYRSLNELPDHAKIFYDEAAQLVGLSSSRLVKLVFTTEQRLKRWQEEKKRNENKKE
jgi:RNA polymerase I-specific transcription initiation factor RRN7